MPTREELQQQVEDLLAIIQDAQDLPVAEVYRMPLDRFERENSLIEVRVPWLPVTLWFCPDWGRCRGPGPGGGLARADLDSPGADGPPEDLSANAGAGADRPPGQTGVFWRSGGGAPSHGRRRMSDRAWKREERRVAALFGGSRFPSNTGGAVDFETDRYVGQVKHVRRLSLRELGALAQEMERLGTQKTPSKASLVVVKRWAGRGRETPRLVVLTETVWRTLSGPQGRPSSPESAPATRTCLWCGEPFVPNAWRSVFCSPECRTQAGREADARPLVGSPNEAEISDANTKPGRD